MLVAASRPWHLAPRRTRGRAREGVSDRFLGMRERKVPTWIWKLRKKIRPSRRFAVLSFLRLAGPLHERRRGPSHTFPPAPPASASNASSMAASIFFLSTQRKGFGTSTTRRSSDVAIVAPARSTRTDVTVRSARYAPFIQRTIAPGVPCISPRICVRVRTAASEEASPGVSQREENYGEQRHLRPDEEQTPGTRAACTAPQPQLRQVLAFEEARLRSVRHRARRFGTARQRRAHRRVRVDESRTRSRRLAGARPRARGARASRRW